jgi:carboxyl-terminal processing protease
MSDDEFKQYKRQNLYKIIMTILLTATIVFIITCAVLYKYVIVDNNNTIVVQSPISSADKIIITSNSTDTSLSNAIDAIQNIVEKYYLYADESDEDELIEGAISGYIEALGDDYSEYIPKDEMEAYTSQIMGNYVGIGIYMVKNTEKNLIQVLTPIKNSPAEEAGILPGDFIISADGVKYTGDEMTAASNNIKGEAGTKVKLEILRGEETLEFEIERKEIALNPVVSEKLDGNIGYIEVSSFDEGTAEDFKNNFETLKSQGITSLIIDLRNNGGGLVTESLQMIDYIVDKGSTTLITVDKNGNEQVSKASEDPIINMPIVVLVNENTASASEIFTAALQDLNKATIVGTTTYGKGIIQQIMSLSDGSGLKLTVEEYYSPNRNKIHKIGITPDEIVELPDEVENVLLVESDQDTQLDKAIELLKK